jgi:hypothetical protein
MDEHRLAVAAIVPVSGMLRHVCVDDDAVRRSVSESEGLVCLYLSKEFPASGGLETYLWTNQRRESARIAGSVGLSGASPATPSANTNTVDAATVVPLSGCLTGELGRSISSSKDRRSSCGGVPARGHQVFADESP